MKVLRAAGHRRMPWKNGGGETAEIAISPRGAGLVDFDWRISMATVASGGPFSIFPGIDRTLSVLQGNGLQLTIDGQEPVLLTQESDPFAFPADMAASALLPDGAITDLNVMTRRGTLAHSVARLVIDGELRQHIAQESFLLVCVRGNVIVETEPERVELDAYDAVLFEDDQREWLHLQGRALCYAVSIGKVESRR